MRVAGLDVELNAVYEKLQESYSNLTIMREDAMEAEEIEINEIQALKDIEAGLRCSGQVEGKNAEEREACLRGKTTKQRISKLVAEAKSRRAKVAIDIAKDKVRMYEGMKDILMS